MKGLWDNSEVQALFNEVEDCKNKNRTLREAFIAHAQKYNRQPNSVRNYYYHEVDSLGKDSKRLKNLGINLERHKKNAITYFSQEEENSLMENISNLVGQGVSVRKACFMLSKGDVGQMLRFQNKYRNFLAKSKSENEKTNILPRENVALSNQDNIITFKKVQKTLSDAEVQSLFMGLVRLVKKNALMEGEEKYKKEIDGANSLLRKALTELNSKEREIEKLKEEYLKIKNENFKLTENLLKNRCEKAEKINQINNGLIKN